MPEAVITRQGCYKGTVPNVLSITKRLMVVTRGLSAVTRIHWLLEGGIKGTLCVTRGHWLLSWDCQL